jgi:uncharacterized protein YwgA
VSKKTRLQGYLDALDLGKSLDSFSDRIRVQKLVYLLKQLDPELRFGYSWYIHGPYSPELTRMIFEGESQLSPEKLETDQLATLNEIRNFLKEDLYSPDRLELIVSVIYLNKNGKELGFRNRKDVQRFLLQEKPQFSETEVMQALEKVSISPLFKRFLLPN